MTRTATTKLIATALAVASLGLASTAQAADAPTPDAGAAPAAPAAPVENAAPEAPAVEQDDQALVQEDTKSEDDKLFERFQKECPNGEFSPGQFCKDYARGKYSKAGPTDQEKDRYERYCKMKDAEPSHSDKAFCKWYEDRYGNKGHGSSTGTTGHGSSTGTNGTDNPGYEKPEYKRTDDLEGTQPAAEKKATKGSLPFTGLEIWQLGLIGIVLVGGGFGARRLLAG